MRNKIFGYVLMILALSFLTACNIITIGGNVTGLTGAGLVLRYHVGTDLLGGSEMWDVSMVEESLSIDANGPFTFKEHFPVGGARFSVTVENDPSGQFCTVGGQASGYPSASISDISVQCHPGFQLLAGHGIGSADGTGAAASFYGPVGIAVDSSGNVYVADTVNHTIRKITPEGLVTTLAGTAGSTGSADGTGADARFNSPHWIAVDSMGNAFVADSGNSTIRKITPEGLVTTLAGTAGSYGSADGTGAEARFSYPGGIALDSAGNVYVADVGNQTIRKITPEGMVTTIAGHTGGVSIAAFGIAVDSSGNVYVPYGSIIQKITPEGVVTTLNQMSFGGLSGDIAVDNAGNVYVVTYNLILQISPAGMVTTISQFGDDYRRVSGLAVSADKLFITTGPSSTAPVLTNRQDTVLWFPKP